jgi:VanZ family protein
MRRESHIGGMTWARFQRGAGVVFYFACILGLSSIPGDDTPRIEIPYLDKVVHFTLYSGLGWMLARTRLRLWLALLTGLLMGAGDEFYQFLTPGRTPSVYDWFADAAGVTAGLLVMRGFLFRKRPGAPDLQNESRRASVE